MSKEDDNKAIVGEWFTKFWGKTPDLSVVDKIAAPDMLLQYSLHAPRKGRGDRTMDRALRPSSRELLSDRSFAMV